MSFIVFILMCYGMTQILTDGSIFDLIRPKYKFFHCPMCMGFWVGALVFLAFWFFDIPLLFFNNIYIGTFLYGCLSSGTSYFLCSIVGDDGINVCHK